MKLIVEVDQNSEAFLNWFNLYAGDYRVDDREMDRVVHGWRHAVYMLLDNNFLSTL